MSAISSERLQHAYPQKIQVPQHGLVARHRASILKWATHRWRTLHSNRMRVASTFRSRKISPNTCVWRRTCIHEVHPSVLVNILGSVFVYSDSRYECPPRDRPALRPSPFCRMCMQNEVGCRRESPSHEDPPHDRSMRAPCHFSHRHTTRAAEWSHRCVSYGCWHQSRLVPRAFRDPHAYTRREGGKSIIRSGVDICPAIDQCLRRRRVPISPACFMKWSEAFIRPCANVRPAIDQCDCCARMSHGTCGMKRRPAIVRPSVDMCPAIEQCDRRVRVSSRTCDVKGSVSILVLPVDIRSAIDESVNFAHSTVQTRDVKGRMRRTHGWKCNCAPAPIFADDIHGKTLLQLPSS